jgi:malonate-semialdehyde dehydrogenase (acetylating)/methylmalonate-semialdehyde dehydrogenase
MLGTSLEDIASGIDEFMIRQPVGVVGIITPFNFPGMIPLWFLPYAVACGNTAVLKPSEKTPLTMARMIQLFEQAGFPPGVVNLVHGGKRRGGRAARPSGRAGDLLRGLHARGALRV